MKSQYTTISARVRIRFKKQPDMVEGYLIFGDRQSDAYREKNQFTWFQFMLNDEKKTEKLFRTTDVERIDYLREA